jgi:protein-tyrosine-phosphatase
MAKVLTERHLGDRAKRIRVLSAGARIAKIGRRFRFLSLVDVAGHTHPDKRSRASLYAVQRISEEFGWDALGRYRIRGIDEKLLANARLIILFGPEFYDDVKRVCPLAERKSVVFHEYFDCAPIPNPWRADQKPGSDEARFRYKETYDALKAVLSNPSNLEKLFKDLTQ